MNRRLLHSVVFKSLGCLAVVVIASFLLFTLAGCASKISAESPQTEELSLREDVETFAHDVGDVRAGEAFSHVFRVENSLNEVVSIKEETDIEFNCGCACISPSSRDLQPAGSAHVTVTVRTAKTKTGPIQHGGRIVWTSGNGRKLTHNFSLRATAFASVLSGKPLPFQKREVEERDLVIKPEVVRLVSSRSGAGRTTRLLLRGRRVAESPPLIDSVTSEAHTVHWEIKRTRNKEIAILELTLTPAIEGGNRRASDLLICIAGAGHVRLPVTELPHSTLDLEKE